MNIAFNINTLGMEGLGATLTSLIRNCSNNEELYLWFLSNKLNLNDKKNIQTLLANENFKGKMKIIDFNAEEKFGHLNSLHGDWTAYGRLLIPEIINSDYALYLDSDLVINLDILELNNFNSDKIISAVFGCTVEHALDSPFLINKLNWSHKTDYFNSGVVLYNLSLWKTLNVSEKIESICQKFPNDLISHDQTLLNAICEGNFTHLSQNFNLPWFPGKPEPDNIKNSIIHFVGSPKPWDIGGRFVHKGFKTWSMYNTAFWKKEYGTITVSKLKRTWNIRRSILKHLKDLYL